MKKHILLTLVLPLVLFTCELNDDTETPDSFIIETEADAIEAIKDVYTETRTRELWGRSLFLLLDFSSDDVLYSPNFSAPIVQFYRHEFTNDFEHINRVWTGFYNVIYQANKSIVGINQSDLEATVKNQYIAEARFLRALSYFYLVNLWGKVPVKTQENPDEVHTIRTNTESIKNLIESDLEFAIDNLPDQYQGENWGRATKGAANALLGKSHLYQEEWDEAYMYLSSVINSNVYELVKASDFGDDAVAAMRSNHKQDVRYNSERVFAIDFYASATFNWRDEEDELIATTVRPKSYGASHGGHAWYLCKPNPNLMDAYEDDDPRIRAFYFGPGDSLLGEPYNPVFEEFGYAWKKYQRTDMKESESVNLEFDVIRYADVLLMKAEASIMLHNIAEGIELINEIRRRADPIGDILPDRPETVTQEEALEFLRQERRVELSGEQTRRMDLLRWKIAENHLEGFQSPKHYLFPIPKVEIDNNSMISDSDNNPGW